MDEVLKEFRFSMEQVLKRRVKRNTVQKAALYLKKEMNRLTWRDLSIYFGGVSRVLITMTANRLAQRQIQYQGLKERIEKIKSQISNI